MLPIGNLQHSNTDGRMIKLTLLDIGREVYETWWRDHNKYDVHMAVRRRQYITATPIGRLRVGQYAGYAPLVRKKDKQAVWYGFIPSPPIHSSSRSSAPSVQSLTRPSNVRRVPQTENTIFPFDFCRRPLQYSVSHTSANTASPSLCYKTSRVVRELYTPAPFSDYNVRLFIFYSMKIPDENVMGFLLC